MIARNTAYIGDFNDVLAQLSEWAIEASVEELRRRDRLCVALKDALKHGADINDLSAVTGLTPLQIRRMANWELSVLSEVEVLAG